MESEHRDLLLRVVLLLERLLEQKRIYFPPKQPRDIVRSSTGAKTAMLKALKDVRLNK